VLRGHVWIFAAVLPALVWLMALRRLVRLLSPARVFRPYAGLGADEIVAAVARRLAHPWVMRRRPCLRQGLTLMHFLRLAGLAAELHVAIYPPSNDPRRLHGHCWVSLDGRDLMPGPGAPSAEMARSAWTQSTGAELTVLPK
jgi:hypothetical protein